MYSSFSFSLPSLYYHPIIFSNVPPTDKCIQMSRLFKIFDKHSSSTDLVEGCRHYKNDYSNTERYGYFHCSSNTIRFGKSLFRKIGRIRNTSPSSRYQEKPL